MDSVELARGLGVTPPDLEARENAIREAIRKLSWEEVVTLSDALRRSTEEEIQKSLTERGERALLRAQELHKLGVLPDGQSPLSSRGWETPLKEARFSEAHATLTEAEAFLQKAQDGFLGDLQRRVLALAQWSGDGGEDLASLHGFPAAEKLFQEGRFSDGLAALEAELPHRLPKAQKRLEDSVRRLSALVPLAKSWSIEVDAAEGRLGQVSSHRTLDLPTYVGSLDQEASHLEQRIREKTESQLAELRQVLRVLSEGGVDVKEPLEKLEHVANQSSDTPVTELPGLVQEAQESVEALVVSVVAGYIDEVRPRFAEARQLRRDAQPAIDAMNEARDFLRQRKFLQAIASAQRSLELASELLADVEAAHAEIQEFREILRRLNTGGFSTTPYEAMATEAEAMLSRGDVERMRTSLQEGLRGLGRESLPFFQRQFEVQDRLRARFRERGWTPPEDLPRKLDGAKQLFQDGRFAETAEALAEIKALTKAFVAPHISQRLEEMGRALDEIPDPQAVGTVRGLLADTDVSLRVRDDAALSLEALDRAEKELSTVFLARSQAVIRELEEERTALASMAVDTSEVQREIAQVREIFDVGDFFKASRASQELKTRLEQQQLVRAEEAVSRAKLAVVEAGKMGLEPLGVRTALQGAQELVRQGRYLPAFQAAEKARTEAANICSTAQRVLDVITKVAELMANLRKQGVPVEDLREFAPRIAEAREAYQSLRFQEAETLASRIRNDVEAIVARRDGRAVLTSLRTLFEEAERIGAAPEDWHPSLAREEEALSGPQPVEAFHRLQELQVQGLSRIRPLLEGQLRTLESDLRSARAVGMDTQAVEEALREARRRLESPIPLGAAQILDQTRRDFFQSRTFVEQALKGLKSARDALVQAELVRVGTADLRKRLDEVESRMAAKDYASAIESAQAIQREVEGRVRDQVNETLAKFQNLVTKSKMEGMLTTVAENFLVQARRLLEEGKPIEALQFASRSESELEKVELQHSLAQNSLLTLQEKLETAERERLHAPGAREDLEKARDLFARGDYTNVLDLVFTATDRLSSVAELRKRAGEVVTRTQEGLGAQSGFGVDLGPFLADNARAKELLDQGKYAEARILSLSAAEGARNAVESSITRSLDEVRDLGAALPTLSPEAHTKFLPILGRAEQAFKSRDWTASLQAIKEAREIAEGTLRVVIEEQRTKLRTLRSALPSPPPTEPGGDLDTRLDEAVQGHRFREAQDLLASALAEIETLRIQALGADVQRLERKVLQGEKLGVETTPVMELFSEAKMNLESRNLEVVPGQIAKATDLLNGLVAPRLEDKLRELESELAFAKEGLNVAVGPVEALALEVERVRATGDLTGAAAKLLEAEEELNQRKARHREFTNLTYLIDAALAQANERKLTATKARELLSEALKLRATDYGKAIELARSALAQVQEALRAPPTS